VVADHQQTGHFKLILTRRWFRRRCVVFYFDGRMFGSLGRAGSR
jgi:hypothetical protein